MPDLGTDYIVRYLSDISDALKGAKQLDNVNNLIAKNIQQKYGQAVRVVGDEMQKLSSRLVTVGKGSAREQVTQNFRTLSQVVQTANGSFLELTKTQRFVDGEFQTIRTSSKDVTSQFKSTALEAEKSGKFFNDLGKNISQLASRALLTVPVWTALRSVMTGTISAIGNSFKALETQSLALQKAKQNLQGTTSAISANFAKLKEESDAIALSTGVTQDKVIAAFQKFATVGFDYKTSIESANNATKLSVILQGDAVETANAFARSMRVLIDTSAGAAPQATQIQEAMSLMLEQWRTNSFEIGEFTESLEKFAGTAKTMNFTIPQTIALLSTLGTAGLRGSQAGTLLKTSIQKLVENLDKLAGSVGIKFNKNLDSSFDVLVRVIDQIKILSETSKLAPEATEAIADIFGGVRGAQPVRALVALREELQKNMALIPDIKKFNDSFEDSEKVLGNLMNRFREANSQIGKALVTGVLGAEDFNKSMEKIVGLQHQVINLSEHIGRVLRDAFIVSGVASLVAFRGQLIKVLALLKNPLALGVTASLVVLNFKEQAEQLARKAESEFKKFNDIGEEFGNQINKGLRNKLSATELSDLITGLETFGADFLKIDTATFDRTLEALRKIKEAQIETEKSVASQKTLEDKLLVGEKDREEFSKLVLNNEIEKLKQMGATNSEILKATDAYSKQLGISEKELDILGRRLERERAINEEKRLQSKLSSDAVKLFDIAKDVGIRTAQNIGDVLAGNTTFSEFVRRGGKDLEIFKKEFADVFKQQQALQFFRGERVAELPSLRRGTSIAETLPLSDQAVVEPVQIFTSAMDIAKQHALQLYKVIQEGINGTQSPINAYQSGERRFPIGERGSNKIFVSPANIEINMDKDAIQVNGKITEDDIKKVGTIVETNIKNKLVGKQGSLE